MWEIEISWDVNECDLDLDLLQDYCRVSPHGFTHICIGIDVHYFVSNISHACILRAK